MARPHKEGLDFFALDCRLNDKIKLIEAEFGLVGFALIVKLYQKIYGERGYYCEWKPENALLFAHENGLKVAKVPRQALVPMRNAGVGVNSQGRQVPYPDGKSWYGVCNLLDELIEASIKHGIFSEEIFNKYQVLTSRGIQERYLNATSRREAVELKTEYLLVKVAHKKVNVDRNSVNVDRNSVNVDRNAQRKEENSKYNNNKEGARYYIDINKESGTKRKDRSLLFPYGKFENVMLTEQEYADLNSTYENLKLHIDDISITLENSSKTYKNHYAFILKIAKEDKWAKKPVKTEEEVRPIETPIPAEERAAMVKELKNKLNSTLKEV